MSSPAQSGTEQIKAAMARTNQIFDSEVFGNRNFDALDQVYTKDARILPPGAAMISGLPGIKDFWSSLIQSVNATSAVLTTVDMTQAGDGLVELGEAVLDINPAGTPAKLIVKYVVFWLQEDGTWKWNIDIWNTNA